MEFVSRVHSAFEMSLPIVMLSAEQKQSLTKDYSKQLQEYGLTDPLEVIVSERTNNIYD